MHIAHYICTMTLFNDMHLVLWSNCRSLYCACIFCTCAFLRVSPLEGYEWLLSCVTLFVILNVIHHVCIHNVGSVARSTDLSLIFDTQLLLWMDDENYSNSTDFLLACFLLVKPLVLPPFTLHKCTVSTLCIHVNCTSPYLKGCSICTHVSAHCCQQPSIHLHMLFMEFCYA